MKKTRILIFLLIILFSVSTPYYLTADTLELNITEKEVVLASENKEIILYQDVTEKVPLLTVPNNSNVILLKIVDKEYSQIRFKDTENNGELVDGYVKN